MTSPIFAGSATNIGSDGKMNHRMLVASNLTSPAISGAAGINDIIERFVPGAALGVDAQRAWREQGNFRPAEAALAARIANHRFIALVRQNGAFARLAAMLPLAKLHRLRDAYLLCPGATKAPRHLPQSTARAVERMRARRRYQEKSGRRNGRVSYHQSTRHADLRSSPHAHIFLYAHPPTFAISIGKLEPLKWEKSARSLGPP